MKRRVLTVAIVLAVLVGAWAGLRRPAPVIVRLGAAAPAAIDVDRGRDVYARYGCVTCHGIDGKGGFANSNAETDGQVPAVIYVAEGYTKAELRDLIRLGKPPIGKADPEGPQPPYTMPGWGDRMPDQDLDALVSYLFSLFPEDEQDVWR